MVNRFGARCITCAVLFCAAFGLSTEAGAQAAIKHITAEKLHAFPASSHAVVIDSQGPLLHIAGQTAITVDFEIEGETVPEQLIVALKNFDLALAAGNATRKDVAQLNVFFVDPQREHIDHILKSVTDFFAPNPPPAISYVGVPMLVGEGMLIEIEGVAVPKTESSK